MASSRIQKVGPLKRVSEALGVMPSQVDEANEYWSKRVQGVEFLKDGRATFSSRKARKEFLRANGAHDKDGGYGD